ncbi:hypothetical protein BU15DRAFT_58113 [Melanogaster broomeanus]|nr:hypothetical protein BU15DRAFT_58113 [Melanogaster broomeanus]
MTIASPAAIPAMIGFATASEPRHTQIAHLNMQNAFRALQVQCEPVRAMQVCIAGEIAQCMHGALCMALMYIPLLASVPAGYLLLVLLYYQSLDIPQTQTTARRAASHHSPATESLDGLPEPVQGNVDTFGEGERPIAQEKPPDHHDAELGLAHPAQNLGTGPTKSDLRGPLPAREPQTHKQPPQKRYQMRTRNRITQRCAMDSLLRSLTTLF